MNRPSFKYEKKILRMHKESIIGGIDEAGRGPLAGPVVIALVIFNNDFILDRPSTSDKIKFFFNNINDSKKVSPRSRERLSWYINDIAEYTLTLAIPPLVIDNINILNATLWGFKKIYLQSNNSGIEISDLLIDGPKGIENAPVKQTMLVNGDATSISIASASILAKTTRDKLMLDYHKKYPEYGFDRHKGYGTKLHYEMLAKHGPCPIHRKSFRLF